MNIIELLKEFKFLITFTSIIITFSVAGYSAYTYIYTSRELAIRQIELTMKSILKTQIKILENNPCKTSREEWADYNILFNQYQELNKKHNPLLNGMHIKPMERREKDSSNCYKGDIIE